MRRAAGLVLAMLLASSSTLAWADGDPASDVLLSQDTFLPYPPNAPGPRVARALRETVARADAKGYPIKVALIAAAQDLGAYPALFTQPQPYADLLTDELGGARAASAPGQGGPRVLVVMPAGLGGNNLGDAAGDALVGVTPGPDGKPDALARTAIVAIGKLAEANGSAIALPPLPATNQDRAGSGGRSAVPTAVVFGAPVLLVALTALFLSRRRTEDED